MDGYTAKVYIERIASHIARGNKSYCYGNGWYTKSISAERVSLSPDRIKVTVRIGISDDSIIENPTAKYYAQSEINKGVNEFISDRVDDFASHNPGILEEVDPKIELVIRVS